MGIDQEQLSCLNYAGGTLVKDGNDLILMRGAGTWNLLPGTLCCATGIGKRAGGTYRTLLVEIIVVFVSFSL